MQQCAARQFENELVERLSILADRHLRPPAPEGGTVSTPVIQSIEIPGTIVRPFPPAVVLTLRPSWI